MNWAVARERWASAPHITAKRDLASLPARSVSSRPSPAPMSSWGFGGKSKARGMPQRRTSTLSASPAPEGTEGCGRLGTWASNSWMRSSRAATSPSRPLLRSPTSRHLGGGVLAAAPRLADGLGGAVALGLEVLGLAQQGPAAAVEGEDLPDVLAAPLVGQAALDLVGALADEPEVEHRVTRSRRGP